MGALGLIVLIVGAIGVVFFGWPADGVLYALICAIAVETGTSSK